VEVEMKLKKTFLVTILTTLFLGGNGIRAQEFYPLEIGNRWDYKRTYWEPGNPPVIDTFSVEIIDDSLFQNGETYFVLNKADLTGGIYVRADSNFIYYYDEIDLEEDTVYRLNAQVGEEWALQFGTISFIRLDSITSSSVFTIPTVLQHYRLDGLILGYVSLSDFFGPVNFSSPGEPPGTSSTGIILIGCLIDNVQYGNPVSTEIEPAALNKFSLSQNYPNPFNPSTKIKFTIPTSPLNPSPYQGEGQRERFITLKIYDVLGNEIATLVNEVKLAGTYEVVFDGGGLSSGIYFYQLKAGPFAETKKMVFLR
jgi:hypothetical protein